MTQAHRELCYLTIGEASRLIQSREISPVELTRAFLDRIETVDGRLKSYVTVLAESVMAEAGVAEAEVLQGKYRGPLHGIPIALKDLYDTKGVRTTAQSKVLEHRIPAEDASTVARLRDAGCLLLGKLAMHEFALGGPETSIFEQSRNPWNLDHITGGSSSGSAAAVAAGLAMGSLGSDTGGSVRGPASLCGIVGLKPTYGRVSRFGVVPLSWSLDHCGPMTWTVQDTALMLQAIAGHDPNDPTSSTLPVPDYSAALREDVSGLTIGVPRHYFIDTNGGISQEAVAAVEKAISDLEELGAHVEEVNIPSLEYAQVANWIMMLSEAFAYHKKNLQTQPQNFGAIVRHRFYLGGLFTAGEYVRAQQARTRIKREFAEALQVVDVVALPTSPTPAASFAEFDPVSFISGRSFMAAFNETGMPAISIPCGFSQSGLPIGFQIAGKPFDEATVLRVAYTYEQYARWFDRRPDL